MFSHSLAHTTTLLFHDSTFTRHQHDSFTTLYSPKPYTTHSRLYTHNHSRSTRLNHSSTFPDVETALLSPNSRLFKAKMNVSVCYGGVGVNHIGSLSDIVSTSIYVLLFTRHFHVGNHRLQFCTHTAYSCKEACPASTIHF